MPNISENNKRIAKNTLLLYCRMFIILAVSLYTSRVVLYTLGIVDYGIYNVVGGVVAMFTFLLTAMNSSTQRYITFYLGKGDTIELEKVFSMALLIHILISGLVFILGETVGLWFVMNKLVIPENRLNAAFWVYQFSILSTIVNIISVPYNSEIIAHEKMDIYAYISTLDVILKLGAVFLLQSLLGDKLMIYALLIFLISVLIRFIYGRYCSIHFKETKFKWPKSRTLFFEMLSFLSWNLWGGVASVLYGQGINILMNIYFGPIVNAARGLAVQVESAVRQFSVSFQVALNPQITKTYSVGNYDEMHSLIIRSGKFTFFLLLIVCLPIEMETNSILGLWLAEVPEYTEIFIRLTLVVTVLSSVANPLMVANAATGRVRIYQSVIGGLMILILPISYIVLELGVAPWGVYIVHIAICIIAFVVRIFLVLPSIKLPIRIFCLQMVLPSLIVMLLSLPIPIAFHLTIDNNLLRLVVVTIVCIVSSSLVSYKIGLSITEKEFVKGQVASFVKRLKS